MASKAMISLLLVAAALLTGCGQSSAEKAKAQVCAARDDIAKQVKQLQGLTLTTATTTQVKDSLEAIQSDLKKVSDASGDLSDQFKQDVKAANEEFTASVKDTVGNLGKTVSVSTAASQLQAALQQLATDYRSTFGTLQCS